LTQCALAFECCGEKQEPIGGVQFVLHRHVRARGRILKNTTFVSYSKHGAFEALSQVRAHSTITARQSYTKKPNTHQNDEIYSIHPGRSLTRISARLLSIFRVQLPKSLRVLSTTVFHDNTHSAIKNPSGIRHFPSALYALVLRFNFGFFATAFPAIATIA
jgi:hypothetical protein